jgi:hypothetical protein
MKKTILFLCLLSFGLSFAQQKEKKTAIYFGISVDNFTKGVKINTIDYAPGISISDPKKGGFEKPMYGYDYN